MNSVALSERKHWPNGLASVSESYTEADFHRRTLALNLATCKSRRSFLSALCLALMATLGAFSNARADFQITVSEAGSAGAPFTYFAPGATPGTINFANLTTDQQNALAAAAPDFSFTGFMATSNSTSLTDSTAHMTSTGQIVYVGTGATAPNVLTIQVTDDHFAFPPGPTYSMASTESYSSFASAPGDSLAFQSFGAPGGTPYGTNFASPGFTFDLSPGRDYPLGSGSNNELATTFTTSSDRKSVV